MPLPHLLDEELKGMKDSARKGQKRELNLQVLTLYLTLLTLYVTKLCSSSHFTLLSDVP